MNQTTDATAILAPIWRRKWLILIVGVLVAVGTYAHYKKTPTSFGIKSQLYLGAASEGQALLNNTLGKSTLNSTALANQAALINSTIGESVHKRFRREHNLDAAKGKVKAKATASSDFIVLTGEAHTATAAAEVVNAYASAYIKHHQENYEHAVRSAIATTTKQIRRIERAELATKTKANGKAASGNSSASTLQTAALSTKLNQLESDLTVTGVQQVGVARPQKAELLGPKPKKNAIFGFVIGLVLATLAVYVASRFNRKLRSLADIEAVFQSPILAALPTVRTPIVRRDGEVRPSKPLNEPLRRLHTTLALEGQRSEGGYTPPRTLLFISADPGDGKSTAAAGLALAQRDANERVVLVEADFRRPVQARLLGLGAPGTQSLADVLVGKALPTVAMQNVAGARAEPAQPAAADAHRGLATAVSAPAEGGSVSVLLGASEVSNPPALLARRETSELLARLGGEFDGVLVDAPAPLQVSDVMPLLGAVDGIVIVARVDHTRESSARRLMEVLARTPSAPVLGVLANTVKRKDMERYGFTSGLSNGSWPFGRSGR